VFALGVALAVAKRRPVRHRGRRAWWADESGTNGAAASTSGTRVAANIVIRGAQHQPEPERRLRYAA